MLWLQRLLLTAIMLLVLAGALLALLLNLNTDPPVDPAWEISAGQPLPEGAVTVRFTGTTTLLFSDGKTDWMVDGWFSRPGLLRIFFSTIAPDLDAISRGLAANRATELAAVIPVHSHYDHAMDAPEVALRTGAILMGSESTANIGRGWNLPERQILVFEDRVPVSVGAFTVTPIESKHYEFPNARLRETALGDPEIVGPLVPPVATFDYKVGKAYVLHVSHPKGDFVIVGSAGYVPGGLAGYKADVVFLGIGGLGLQTEKYREDFWRETVATLEANRVIPVHWDSLTSPIEGPFEGSDMLLTILTGGDEKNILPFLKSKQQANPGLTFQTLPRYDQVVLFP